MPGAPGHHAGMQRRRNGSRHRRRGSDASDAENCGAAAGLIAYR
jgi:hypothetical protein